MIHFANDTLPFLIVDLILTKRCEILLSPILTCHIIQPEISCFLFTNILKQIFALTESPQYFFITVLPDDWKIVQIILTCFIIAAGKCIYLQFFDIIVFFLIFPDHHSRQETIRIVVQLPLCHKKCGAVRCEITFKRPVSEIPIRPIDKETDDHLHQHTFSATISE